MDSQVLSQKRVNLAAPGTERNNLYYTPKNSSVDQAEVLAVNGRFEYSLTTLAFGSTSTIHIPHDLFCSNVYLTVELPQIGIQQALACGWLYNLIDSVQYTWGSSNVSSLRYTGATLKHIIMGQLGTSEKRSHWLKAGGSAAEKATTAPIVASIQIPMPWNTVESHGKIPFDCSTLGSDIQIQLSMKPARAVYGGQDVPPTQFTSAVVTLKQIELSDRSMSVSQSMLQQPTKILPYPFIHKTSPSSKFGFKTLEKTVVELTEFLNADLTAIQFSVSRIIDQEYQNDNKCPSGFSYLEVSSPVLKYNGRVIWRARNNLADLICSEYDEGAMGADAAYLEGDSTAGFSVKTMRSRVYRISLTDCKGLAYHESFCNGRRFGNSTMSLEFTPLNIDAADTTKYDCQLDVTHHYNSVAEIQNQQVNIILA